MKIKFHVGETKMFCYILLIKGDHVFERLSSCGMQNDPVLFSKLYKSVCILYRVV
jgi:hypothetical protein